MKATVKTRTEETVVLEMTKEEAQGLRDILGARRCVDSYRGDDPLHRLWGALLDCTENSGKHRNYPLWRVCPDAD